MEYSEFIKKVRDKGFYCSFEYENLYIRHEMGGEYGDVDITNECVMSTCHNQFSKMGYADKEYFLNLLVELSTTPIRERGILNA